MHPPNNVLRVKNKSALINKQSRPEAELLADPNLQNQTENSQENLNLKKSKRKKSKMTQLNKLIAEHILSQSQSCKKLDQAE